MKPNNIVKLNLGITDTASKILHIMMDGAHNSG